MAVKNVYRSRLWKLFGSDQFLRRMWEWEYFTLKRTGARQILADAAQQKEKGKQGQWQQESPFKKVLEHVRRSADTYCGLQTVLRAYIAVKHGNWKRLFKGRVQERKESFCELTFEGIREDYEKVATDDIGRLSIAQEILRKSTDTLRRIIAPVDGMGGVTMANVSQCVVASLCRRNGLQHRWCKDSELCGKGPTGKASGPAWTHGT